MKNEIKQSLDRESVQRWNTSYNISKTETLWGSDHVPFIKKAVRCFKSGSGTSYLDLPCGDGRNLIPLAQNLPFVIGADTSSNALLLASKRISTLKMLNCLLLRADIFATGFCNEQFDGVFCWDVLGHLIKVKDAITELLRVLKSGAKLIGSVFAIGDSTRGVDMQMIGDEEYLFAGKFYFKYYDRGSVVSLLKDFKVKVISLKTFSWNEPPHEGYREYPHTHKSWVFIIEKQ